MFQHGHSFVQMRSGVLEARGLEIHASRDPCNDGQLYLLRHTFLYMHFLASIRLPTLRSMSQHGQAFVQRHSDVLEAKGLEIHVSTWTFICAEAFWCA
jgi:hypothetical protein